MGLFATKSRQKVGDVIAGGESPCEEENKAKTRDQNHDSVNSGRHACFAPCWFGLSVRAVPCGMTFCAQQYFIQFGDLLELAMPLSRCSSFFSFFFCFFFFFNS
jgi:hypothetical protein